MKIKFLKPFRLYNPIGDDMMMGEGAVENMEKEDYAQWLIDNGFAEEVKESGWWKPKRGDKYWYIGLDNFVHLGTWENSVADNGMLKLGLIFKTEEAGVYFRDYLEAVVTVKQDEGVLTPEQINERIKNDDLAYYVGYMGNRGNGEVLCGCVVDFEDCWMPVGTILFDSEVHADRSLRNHPDEWKIIANYDWSRE